MNERRFETDSGPVILPFPERQPVIYGPWMMERMRNQVTKLVRDMGWDWLNMWVNF